jgi:DNA-binding response OmpR family regulator
LRPVAPCSTGFYTRGMPTAPSGEVRQVGLLVLEDDSRNAAALKQILDSEGWRVRTVPDLKMLHAELKTGEYSLVVANIAIVGLESPTYHVLRELSAVAPEDGGRIRVLYVIPEMTGGQFVGPLEMARLPYALRPFHLHDFLEKVSDLLVEIKAIVGPLRMTRYEFGAARKKKKQDGRSNSMFAARDSYSYTEEELAEYERAEAESSRTRRIKPRTNLGDPRS